MFIYSPHPWIKKNMICPAYLKPNNPVVCKLSFGAEPLIFPTRSAYMEIRTIKQI